ncbi:hypothetical protein C2E23DRAFT_570122 [Lenzites betulinus]|nr:hypothetical protein C2E23DRAFT_570122 [Lenzites betulinus]
MDSVLCSYFQHPPTASLAEPKRANALSASAHVPSAYVTSGNLTNASKSPVCAPSRRLTYTNAVTSSRPRASSGSDRSANSRITDCI